MQRSVMPLTVQQTLVPLTVLSFLQSKSAGVQLTLVCPRLAPAYAGVILAKAAVGSQDSTERDGVRLPNLLTAHRYLERQNK